MKRIKGRNWIIGLCAAISFGFAIASCNNTGGKAGIVHKTDTVIIQNMEFQPANLKINKGDTVVWINKGIVAHNVTEDTAHTWTSGDINVGSSWKKVVDSSFHYECSIHPTMKASVVVVKK